MKKSPRQKSHKPASLRYNITKFDDYAVITEQDNTKNFVYMNLVVAVRSAVAERSPVADLFKLADSNVQISLPKEGWKPSLVNAIDFFQAKEMFETCAECQKLISLI
jgi:hypothetical protein